MNPTTRMTNWPACLQYLLLAVMLWPGPIPIGHVHAGADSSYETLQLSRHLQAHHSDPATSCCSSQWHLHWVVPVAGYVSIEAEESVLCSPCVEARVNPAPQCESAPGLTPPEEPGITACVSSTATSVCFAGATKLPGQLNDRDSSPALLVVMRC